jgi:DNA-binding NarL/FixJ family response regulator
VIRLGLVDDHTLVREGIRSLLALIPDVAVVMEAGTGEAALDALDGTAPDVLLLDLRMPGGGGLDVLRALRGRVPAIVLTTFRDDADLFEAMRLGARGYLMKDVTLDQLIGAIREVHAGGTHFQPIVTAGVRAQLAQLDAEPLAEPLTEREVEVLRLMSAGFTNRELGDALGVTEGTIKNHVSNILGKLGVKDRTRAVLTAIERGLV